MNEKGKSSGLPLVAPSAAGFGAALIEEARRRLLGESLPRLRTCLVLLTDDAIWARPNAATPSVGNLVLHLCGNVRQWIISGLAGAPDERERRREFEERGPLPRALLLELLERRLAEVDAVLGELDPAALLAVRSVQGFEETGLSILVHVVEHFSYHVGQVSYVVKASRGVDLGYYAGADLEARGGPPAPAPRPD